jgi:hypothetical protein
MRKKHVKSKPRGRTAILPADKWAQLRAEYTAGVAGIEDLAKRYRVSSRTIRHRRQTEKWRDPQFLPPGAGTGKNPRDQPQSKVRGRSLAGLLPDPSLADRALLRDMAIVDAVAAKVQVLVDAHLERTRALGEHFIRLHGLLQDFLGDDERARDMAKQILNNAGIASANGVLSQLVQLAAEIQRMERQSVNLDQVRRHEIAGGPVMATQVNIQASDHRKIDVSALATPQLEALGQVLDLLDGEDTRPALPRPPGAPPAAAGG